MYERKCNFTNVNTKQYLHNENYTGCPGDIGIHKPSGSDSSLPENTTRAVREQVVAAMKAVFVHRSFGGGCG